MISAMAFLLRPGRTPKSALPAAVMLSSVDARGTQPCHE